MAPFVYIPVRESTVVAPAVATKSLTSPDGSSGGTSSTTGGHSPRPITKQICFVESKAEGTPELVVGQLAVTLVVQAGKEPPAVFRVHKVPFLGADVGISGNRANFGTSVARRCLGRPNANFPAIVKNETIGTSVLENGVVIFILVELDTPNFT